MFREVVNDTALTSGMANDYFSGIIYGDRFCSDSSFLATMRALFPQRMSEDDPNIRLCFWNTSYTEDQVREHGEVRIMDAIVSGSDFTNPGCVTIFNFNNRHDENNKACMEVVRSAFTSRFDGWELLEKAELFFKKSFDVTCFIDAEQKRVAIFCDSLNMRKMHYLQCGILAFFPWYFNPEEGVSELEMRLINSLRDKDGADDYINCIEEFAVPYDFRVGRIRNLLKGFETRYERTELRLAEGKVESFNERIQEYNDCICDILRKKREEEIRILGLRERINSEEEGDSEIMEYFIHNKNLSLEDVNDETIRFTCQTYLEYFNEDMAESVIENKRSYVYILDGMRCNNYIAEEDMELLMRAIFLDGKIKIKFCGGYRFDLGGRVLAVRGYNFGSEFREFMPNPHIDYYSCLGDYERSINEFLQRGDYIGAIEQCLASCKSLNFGDSTVMDRFMRDMYGFGEHNRRCIELPDGSVVEPEGAIEFLKGEGNGKDN